MNAPDRYERFVVPEDEAKIKYEKDPRVVNAGTFTVQREDHTIGNLVRMKLLEDPDVIFAGYKIPHPLEYKMLFKVQTKNSKYKPRKAMLDALDQLAEEVESIKSQFTAEEDRYLQGQQPGVY